MASKLREYEIMNWLSINLWKIRYILSVKPKQKIDNFQWFMN